MESTLVLLSEAALALYPILIKRVPTDLGTQLVARLLTYSVLGFSLARPQDIQATWGSLASVTKSSALGLMTLAHVASSYFAFQELPAGISMSLFYFYPIFNILGAALGYGESFSVVDLLLVGVAMVGVLLVAYSSKEGEGFAGEAEEKQTKEKQLNWKGILAGLLAALTESGMYFAVKEAGKQPTPFYAILQLYPAALPLLLAGLYFKGHTVDLRPSVGGPMLIFNALVGFVGYCLRFYAIPRLPTLVFSVLSLVGVIASFGWGYLFVGEIPKAMSIAGGVLIGLAAGLTKSSKSS